MLSVFLYLVSMKPLIFYVFVAVFILACSGLCDGDLAYSDSYRYFTLDITKGGKPITFSKVFTIDPFLTQATLRKIPVSYRHNAVTIAVIDSLNNPDTVIVSYVLSEASYNDCYNEGRIYARSFSIKHHTFDSSYKFMAYEAYSY